MNEGPSLLTVNDFIGVPIVLIFFFLLIKWLAPKYIQNKKLLQLFYIGLFARFIGIIFSVLFHMYIERQGDTHAYFYYGTIISKYFSNNGPLQFFNLLNSDYPDLPFVIKSQLPTTTFFSDTFSGNKLIILITALASYFTFDSYLAIYIIFTLWSYFGVWLIFSKLTQFFPLLRDYLFLFIICWPSLLFFGSGVLKDPLCLGAIGVLFYIAFDKVGSVFDLFKKTCWVFIAVTILYLIKPYLFVSFLFAFTITKFYSAINSNSLRFYRKTIYLLMATVLCGGILFIVLRWESIISSKGMQELYVYILRTSQGQLALGNTKYDLGKLEMNPTGILKYLLMSLNVGLFRPYIFEISKPQLLLSGSESLIMLLLAIYTIWKVRFKVFLNVINNSPMLLFSLLFTMIVAIEIGAISFNFGTLVRYKIPIVPFFFAFFLVVLSKGKSSVSRSKK